MMANVRKSYETEARRSVPNEWKGNNWSFKPIATFNLNPHGSHAWVVYTNFVAIHSVNPGQIWCLGGGHCHSEHLLWEGNCHRSLSSFFLRSRVYWQTIQKICTGTSALPQSFEQCGNSCSFVQSIRILSTRGDWQTVYIFCDQSANNLLLADHSGLPITPIFSYEGTVKSFKTV